MIAAVIDCHLRKRARLILRPFQRRSSVSHSHILVGMRSGVYRIKCETFSRINFTR